VQCGTYSSNLLGNLQHVACNDHVTESSVAATKVLYEPRHASRRFCPSPCVLAGTLPPRHTVRLGGSVPHHASWRAHCRPPIIVACNDNVTESSVAATKVCCMSPGMRLGGPIGTVRTKKKLRSVQYVVDDATRTT
jgi:hypothetical protein